MSADLFYTFETLRNRLTVSGKLVAMTALRVGAGRASGVVGNDLPVLRDVLGDPLIPGASLKGALRAQVEALIRALHPGQARDLLETEKVMRLNVPLARQVADQAAQREVEASAEETAVATFTRAALADQYYTEALVGGEISTLMDLTFGAPWLAGRLAIRDARVDRELWFGQYEVRNGVALNRDTETAEDGLLYDYEVVPAGTRFDFRLTLENAADWQLGLIMMALQPWTRGEVQIGGFRSRGLGYVALDPVEYRYVRVENADDVLRLVCDETTLSALGLGRGETLLDTDPAAQPLKGWYEQLRETLRTGRPAA